ncbi:SLIT and NTRK-like protein 6 [Hippocampus zosterae]|uniref:SLIT and NTRK-like protein 6 n=1 Tax=Hippocampus zosterae TaxID=109293 RepID=UPI00223D5729|nr:SLIT and NTRK-like protein 6 [Hippocampus zosterae]
MLSKYGILLVFGICSRVCIATCLCPIGCCCLRPGVLVVCESSGLRSLPRSLPLNTAVLSVAKNRLCNVDHLLLPFTSLQELSLSHNLLARFPRGLPPSLEELFLQQNRITYITVGALRQLRNLTLLDLRDNHIRAIQPGALQNLKNLQVLMLKGNKLASLCPNRPAFLTHLDVSANCIFALAPPPLPTSLNVHILKISRNCLRSVLDSNCDKGTHLRSVERIYSKTMCECDILYRGHWMLSSWSRMTSTDLECTEPGHLAYHLLLNLSMAAICPGILKPNEMTLQLKALIVNPVSPWVPTSVEEKHLEEWSAQQGEEDTSAGHLPENKASVKTVRMSCILDGHLFLHTLTYRDCLTFNKSQNIAVSHSTPSPYEESRHKDKTTVHFSQMITTHLTGTRASFFTKNDTTLSTRNHLHWVLSWLPAVVSVFFLLLMLLFSSCKKRFVRARVALLGGH